MVMVDREKMSKSLGNFFTVRDVLKFYDAETIRYFLMSGHYRSQLNYSEENLKQARSALERLYTALRGTDKTAEPAGGEAFEARFEAMDDDFNTPEAYSVLFDMAREVNRLKTEDAAAANAMAAHMRKLSSVLGLLEQEPDASCRAARRRTTGSGGNESFSSSVWTRVKRKTGRRRMPRVTVSTRWASCWKMARRAPWRRK
jgi:cysteinyl-tRNA synthetase